MTLTVQTPVGWNGAYRMYSNFTTLLPHGNLKIATVKVC